MEIPVVAISAAPMNGPQEPLRVDVTLPKPFDPDAPALDRDAHGGPQASTVHVITA